MSLSKVIAVFRKDLRDILRDRRTLIFMILLPTLALPLLMMGAGRFLVRAEEKRREQTVRIAMRPIDRDLIRRLVTDWQTEHAVEILRILHTISPDGMGPILATLQGSPKEQMETLRRLRAGERVDPRLPPELEEDVAAVAEDFEEAKRKGRIDREHEGILEGWLALDKFMRLSEFVDLEEITRAAPGPGPPPADRYPDWVRGDRRALAIAEAIASKRIQAAIILPLRIDDVVRGGTEESSADVYFDSTIPASREAESRIRGTLKAIGGWFLQGRLARAGLPDGFVRPLEIDRSDIAPRKKQVRAVIGGLLPYVIILFSFLGAVYPALDLGAGEKERYTLETLLLSPASRFEIAMGKFLVILLASMVAALLALGSVAWTISHGILPKEVMAGLDLSFDPLAILVSALMTLPVASIFASILLSVSIYARSFKEGQSYAVPLQFLIIIPALASLIPDVEVSWKLALIPVLNVSVVMREFMKGEYLWGFFALAMASTLLLAAASITFAARWFDREQVIFRH